MLQNFWQEFLIVWHIGILDTSLGDIFLALTIFLAFLFARRIVFRFLSNVFKKLAKRTQTDMDDRILDAIERPLEFTFVIIGLYISGQFVSLSPTLNGVFEQIIRSLIAFTIFWSIFRILDPLSILLDRFITLFGNHTMHENHKRLFRQSFKIHRGLLRRGRRVSRMGFQCRRGPWQLRTSRHGGRPWGTGFH